MHSQNSISQSAYVFYCPISSPLVFLWVGTIPCQLLFELPKHCTFNTQNHLTFYFVDWKYILWQATHFRTLCFQSATFFPVCFSSRNIFSNVDNKTKQNNPVEIEKKGLSSQVQKKPKQHLFFMISFLVACGYTVWVKSFLRILPLSIY